MRAPSVALLGEMVIPSLQRGSHRAPTRGPCDRRLQLDRVSDVDGVRRKRDNSRIAVQAPAAMLVEAARTRVLLQHPQMAAFAAEVTYPRQRVIVEPRAGPCSSMWD
jgi:hypothetical protein